MKERPMLFSGPMVRAIIEGQKTVTRRMIKPQPSANAHTTSADGTPMGAWWETGKDINRCPYGQPGDRLWVRETFAVYGDKNMAVIHYRADRPHHVGKKGMGYKPSIHMPRWVSRILLEITAVRVERLHEMKAADCIAEGCSGGHGSIPGYNYSATPGEHFRHIWESTGGDYFANPWVWVIEFKRVLP